MITSAVLFAAGRGKRQRPFTDETPKPLLQINGRSALDTILCAAARAGIQRICIVTGHLEEQIFAFVGDGSRWNLEVSYAHQNELRGNGDAMSCVPLAWRRNEPVMIAATDYFIGENTLLELVEAHEKRQADITMSIKECSPDQQAARSSAEVDSSWRVWHIIEKPKPEEVRSPYAATLLVILPAQIWEYLLEIKPSPRGEIEVQSAVEMMIQDGYKAFGVLQPAPLEWTPPEHEAQVEKK